jgi:SAM-dependent methyltransferase
MRLGVIPETVLDRIILAAGVVPIPLGDTMVALLLARTIMAGTKFGVFDALVDGPLTPAEVASRCGTHARATEKLLFALAGARYLRFENGRYSLSTISRKWLSPKSPRSLKDAVLMRYLDLRHMDHAEEYVQTGQPTEFHEKLSPEEWDLYQKGQRSGALYSAPEVAKRTPVPPSPRSMLDIGGGHGYYSVALCRRHSNLRSTILDLPGAAVQSTPLIEREDVGGRITYNVGNALTDDLGQNQYDLVFMANVAHHFGDPDNRQLTVRIARALRSGGYYIVLDIVSPATTREAGQIGALLGFYFAITSAAGTWSFSEIAAWQSAAGLEPQPPVKLRTSPGYGLQAARKP